MRFTYCPHCGTKLIGKEIGDEGVIPYCEKCSTPLWDMFTTSIITAVVNEFDEVALLRQDYVTTSSYVCVAGIMKLGESAEETVIREVKEEIGQDVESLEFIKSYPYEKKEMLMLGFKAKVRKKDFVLSGEVDSAEWFGFDEVLSHIREGSIAWQLVKAVIEDSGKEGNKVENKKYDIVRVSDRPELKNQMAAWFHEKWGVPLEAYSESMEDAINSKMIVPQWYAMFDGDKIIAGAGVIDNDFHDRPDLTPNVCAVFSEPEYRCKGLAGQVLDFICKDMAAARIETLYLVTDHTSFYERYGWEYLCQVHDEDGGETRMYIHREV